MTTKVVTGLAIVALIGAGAVMFGKDVARYLRIRRM